MVHLKATCPKCGQERFLTIPYADTEAGAIEYFNKHVRCLFEHGKPNSVQQVIDFANAACDGVWRLEAVNETRQIY